MYLKAKAISPLVAALLLIMVGIAGMVLVYLWLTGFAGKSTMVPASMELQLKIEAVKMNASKNEVIIYVRNTGSTTIECGDIYNVTVYVYDSYTGKLVDVDANAKISCGDTILEPGELGKVNATINGLTKGDYYDVKLIISGVEYTFASVRSD